VKKIVEKSRKQLKNQCKINDKKIYNIQQLRNLEIYMPSMELIKKLRDMTQAGVMDAKKALEENGDNLEQAVQ
jgi:hypothetical protein